MRRCEPQGSPKSSAPGRLWCRRGFAPERLESLTPRSPRPSSVCASRLCPHHLSARWNASPGHVDKVHHPTSRNPRYRPGLLANDAIVTQCLSRIASRFRRRRSPLRTAWPTDRSDQASNDAIFRPCRHKTLRRSEPPRLHARATSCSPGSESRASRQPARAPTDLP